jgi:hypothetical protein
MVLNASLNFEEDTIAMLDSLRELFQERGDKVTATLIAERMGRKLNRPIHYHRAAYLYRLHGFYSKYGRGHFDASKCYVIPDFDLLTRLRMKYYGTGAKKKINEL